MLASKLARLPRILTTRPSKRSYSSINKPVRVLKSSSHNAFVNLATEEWIFNNMDTSKPVMFLWRNGPTVVIGRHQNPWKECHVTEMEARGVTLARRRSGGGAVYQDLGNSIFTFLSSKQDHSLERNFDILKKAIDSLGVESQFTGRNDIVVDGRKISGSAFKNTSDRCFHHGTVLVDVKKDDVEKFLNVNKLKLQSKGVDSVKQRITNLTDFNPDITHESLCSALITQFCHAYGQDPHSVLVENLDERILMENAQVRTIHDELSSWDWRFGHTPDFEYNLETRFSWGIIDLYITCTEGKVSGARIFSDTLYPVFVEVVQNSLHGVTYDQNGIKSALKNAKLQLAGTPSEGHIDELQTWLLSKI